MSAETAFWDLYDRDEKGCEATYVRQLEAELATVTAERDAARRVIEAAIVQMKVETERAEEGSEE